MGLEKGESTAPGNQAPTQTRNMKTIVIDSQIWLISTKYKNDLRALTFQKVGSDFLSINRHHPTQDFTPSVLRQAFDAYVARYPNVPSELRQQVMQRVRMSQTPSCLAFC